MPLTRLEPTAALVLNDLQNGIVRQDLGPTAPRQVVTQCVRLATAFRAAGLLVVLVGVAGGPPGRVERQLQLTGLDAPDFGDYVPEIGPDPQDVLLRTRNWNAFYGTSLDLELRRHGVAQVVLGGISTSSGVESTARAAHDRGFHVVVANDAVTDFDPNAHVNSLERIFPKLGETASTEEILHALDARSNP